MTTVTSAIPVLRMVCRTGKTVPGAEKIAAAAIAQTTRPIKKSRPGLSSSLTLTRPSPRLLSEDTACYG
jgi:hypothetical protein